MRIFFSDTHLGDGSATDDFHRDKEFIEFLTFARDNKVKELVGLGDLYELWQARLDRIMWAHSDVFKALDRFGRKFIHVYGNHDYFPFSRLTPEVYHKKGIYAVHGHQCDEFNRYKNPLFALRWPVGKYVTLLVAEFERWFHKDTDVWLEKMKERFGDFLVEAALIRNKIGQSPLILEDKINISGHAHEAMLTRVEPSKMIYGNCGAWVDDCWPTFISVDENVVQLRNGLDFSVIKEIVVEEEKDENK